MLKPILAILFLGSLVANGQPAQSSLTDQDYSRAASFLGPNLSKYIDRSSVRPNWIDGTDFWYRVLTEKGSEYVLVEAKEGKRRPAFDHEKLAGALSKQAGTSIDAANLPFRQIRFSEDKKVLSFIYKGQDWSYDIKKNELSSRAIFMLKGKVQAERLTKRSRAFFRPIKPKKHLSEIIIYGSEAEWTVRKPS